MAGIIATLQDDKGTNLYPQTKWEAIADPPTIPTNYLNSSDLQVHGWSSTGISLLNGANKRTDADTTMLFHYAYIQLKGYKLVTLRIAFSNAKETGYFVQIPASIAPSGYTMHVTQAGNSSQSSGLYIEPDGRIKVLVPVPNATDNTEYICTTTYLRKD